MRLLDRYLLRELMVPLGYCLAGFLIFWIAFDLFSELHGLQQKHLLAHDIAEYYLFRIPDFLILVLPVALLLALLYALTNHARYNEITAIRTAGVSLWRLCLPYLAVGFVATLALFALNEFFAPKMADIAEKILIRRLRPGREAEARRQLTELSFVNSRGGRFWHLWVNGQKPRVLVSPVVQWHLPDGTWRYISADRAIYTNGNWEFLNVRESKETAASNSLPTRPTQTNVVSFPDFTETPTMISSLISVSELHDHPTRTHRANIPIAEILTYLRLNPRPAPGMKSWIYTKLYGRFAGPCACLVVVLVAIPFATTSGRRNVFVGVAASIFFFFIYFFLQQLGFVFGEAGRVPAWLGAWLPNLFFGVGGLLMMARTR